MPVRGSEFMRRSSSTNIDNQVVRENLFTFIERVFRIRQYREAVKLVK